MQILITGASGFIGRNLKEQLAEKYEILAPSRDELDLLDAGKVQRYLEAHGFAAVIHAATWDATRNSDKDTSLVLEHNLTMFLNIARCSSAYGKLIHFGSGAEFAREHWIPRMKEDYFGEHVPQDSYGLSKYLIHQHGERADNIVNLRLFGVFGKYEDWEIRFISNACCKAILDLPITIKQNVRFDYLYVDDLVRITDWFIQNRPEEKAYNICTGQTHDLITLAEKVLRVSGKELEIRVARPGLGTECSGDPSKFLRRVGGFAFSDIDASVKELYEWYQSHRADIDRGLLVSDK